MIRTVKDVWQMACPKCGDCLRMDVSANVWVRLCADGTDVYEATNQDHEWSEDSKAFCGTCEHHGDVAAFRKAGELP